MADLAKSTAEWNALFAVIGAETQLFDALESWFDRSDKLRSLPLVSFDQQGIFTAIDVAGEAVVDQNTDAEGQFHVTFTGGASPSTQFYKDSAKAAGDLVASAATASGATTILNEKNSSGLQNLAVTVKDDAGDAIATDSDIIVQVTQDFKRMLEDEYSNINDPDQDESETKSKDNVRTAIASVLRTMYSRRKTAFERDVLLGFIASFLNATEADRRQGSGFRYTYDTTTIIGQVLITDRFGIWAQLRQAMLDNTNPVGGAPLPQTLALGSPSSGTLVAATTNTGKLRGEGLAASVVQALSLALSQHVLSGTLTLRCTQRTVGATILTVENVLDEKLIIPMFRKNSRESVPADHNATVDQRFQDGPLGVDFTARYVDGKEGSTLSESGDDGGILSASTITSPNETDTNVGKIFLEIEKSDAIASGGAADEFTIRMFSDSARSVQTAETTVLGFSGVSSGTTLTTTLGMAFATNFLNTAASTQLPNKGDKDSDIEFDLQVPRIGDKWEITLTEDFASRQNRFFARRYGGSTPAGGAPTIPDSLAKFYPTLEPLEA